MFGYAPQRHRFPLICSRTSSSVGPHGSLSRAAADMIWPAVQYPRWKASCSMNASCTGWRTPFHSFDRDDVVAFMHYGEREARKDATAIDVNGACAALAVIAALLGSEELELLA